LGFLKNNLKSESLEKKNVVPTNKIQKIGWWGTEKKEGGPEKKGNLTVGRNRNKKSDLTFWGGTLVSRNFCDGKKHPMVKEKKRFMTQETKNGQEKGPSRKKMRGRRNQRRGLVGGDRDYRSTQMAIYRGSSTNGQ